MANTRQQDFITTARQATTQIWEAITLLQGLQREWEGLDYGNTLADGTGSNAGITAVSVGAVVFDTTDALIAVLNAGHATNMAKLL